jgi:TM2 domain-containing membrane protein YozV
MRIMLARDGQKYGPFTIDQVNTMLAAGKAAPDDLAWVENTPEWVALATVPGVLRTPPSVGEAGLPAMATDISDRQILPAFLLAFFLGPFGVHRFYVGKTGSGIAMLVLTLTLVGAIVTGIWALVDWIVIVCGGFTDGEGRQIRRWT